MLLALHHHHPLEPSSSSCRCWEMPPSGSSDDGGVSRPYNSTPSTAITNRITKDVACPSCGHQFDDQRQGQQGKIWLLPGLPAGVRFDPTDSELLEHLERKARGEREGDGSCHPLIDEFIPTLEGENGICCMHPEKLPGNRNDALIFDKLTMGEPGQIGKRRDIGM